MLGDLPIDRYVKLQLMFEEVGTHMRAQLDSLHCRFDPTPGVQFRKLGARYTEEPGVDIFDDEEIKRAIMQEVCCELIHEGITSLYRNVDQFTSLGNYDHYEERNDLYSPTGASIYPKLKTAFEKAVLLHGYQPWAIVSTAVLSALRTHGAFSKENISDLYCPLKYMGVHLGVRVYVDQFSHRNEPVIFGGKESLSYQADSFIEYGGHRMDPNTFEQTHSFLSRFRINHNPTKLYAMKVKFASLGCFL